MADVANDNYFDKFDPDKGAGVVAPAPSTAEANPFDKYGPDPDPAQSSSTTGAFVRGAERGALPAVGGLAGAGAGAAGGAEVGGAIGSLGGPVGTGIGAGVGAIVGGVAGAFGGSYVADKAQEYALTKAPDTWKEAIGQDDRQTKLDQEQHPYASFLGGLAPYALTMNPTTAAAKLPENATALQRLMTNPVTARVFGGAAMGGMELGQEAAGGQPVDWGKVAISTAFGVVLNRPNRLGETIEGSLVRPFQRTPVAPIVPPAEAAIPRPSLEPQEPLFEHPDLSGFEGLHTALTERQAAELPTLAEAADLGVMGPGITEDVFMGAHEQEPQAKASAQDLRRTEQQYLGTNEPPDLEAAARRIDPDSFAVRDLLLEQRDNLRARIAEAGEAPPPLNEAMLAKSKDVQDAETRLAELTTQHNALRGQMNNLGGEATPELLEASAKLQESYGAVRDAMAERNKLRADLLNLSVPGAGPVPPEQVLALSAHLQTIEQQLRNIGPDVAAARRRAADSLGAPTVPAEPIPKPRERPAKVAAPATEAEVAGGAPSNDNVGATQPFSIEDDVHRKLIAAGRPADEAAASAKLTQALYETHAARVGGDANEIYQREAPDIRAGQIRIRKEFAQGRELNQALPSLTPAIRHGGKVYRADEGSISHMDALAKVPQEQRAAAMLDGNNRVYKTETGRVLDRWRAQDYAVKNDLISEKAPSFAKSSPELIAEWLKSQRELEQASRGKIRFSDGRTILTLMRDANASTYVHELGHDWLERVLRDAEDPKAIDSLKADAATIRAAIGAKAGETIPTKAHEKFARAFEQYLREGVAPSAPLARVFAQFRNWLLEVYQTIKGLGAPISEDIRGVFDRMLSAEPQRTVISPERPGGPSLSDIHRVDAALTEPRDADAQSDRVRAERQRAIEEAPHEIVAAEAEIQAERAATTGVDAGGENGGGAERLREVEPGGGQAGAESERGGVGAERGAISGGGGQAAAESGAVRGAGSDRSAGSKSQPLAPTPARLFNPADERFVDRAGNIRVENLTDVAAIARAIHDSADRNDDFRTVRGRVTKGQMNDLADDMGLDASRITESGLGKVLGGTDNLAPRILAARKLVVDSAEIVSNAMAKAADSDNPQDMADYAQAVIRHDMIQSALAGVTAEWGRAGSAFHTLMDGWDKAQPINDFLKANTGRDLYQLKLMAKLGKNLDSPGKVSKFLRDAGKRSGGRMILEYFINNLISGPATHVTYLLGNTIAMVNKIGPETLTAAAIGRAREAAGRPGEHVSAGESGAGLRELVRALPKALQSGIEGARTGQTTLLPGEKGHPLLPFSGDALPSAPRIARTIGNEDVAWHEVKADLFGALQGGRDALVAWSKLLSSGGDPGAPFVGLQYSPAGYVPNVAIKGVTVAPIGSLVRVPSRGVAAIHSFFRTMNYSVENNAKAFRQATAEGLTGPARAARTGELRQNPSTTSMEGSIGVANDLTLMASGRELVARISRVTNWAPNLPVIGETPILKFIDPFVHIAANIIDQSLVQRTPLGLLATSVREDLMGKHGNVAQDLAQARMLVGSAMAITFGGLAAEGFVTGSGPSDPDKAAMWRLAGHQAHSVVIGDMSYDMHRLGPLGMLLGVAADMYDVAHHAAAGDMLTAGVALQHGLMQNVLDESFMRGPAELIQAVTEPGRYGERYIQNFLSSFVPYSVGLSQVDRGVDPYSRRARTVMDSIRQKLPWASQELFPNRTIWGDPLPNRDALGAAGVTAIFESRLSRDPVNIALTQLGMGPKQVPSSIRNVKLTGQQWDDFARIAGRMSKLRLDTIIRSPDWQNWDPATKRNIVTEVVKQSRETARGILLAKYPSIAAQAVLNKRAKNNAPTEDEE